MFTDFRKSRALIFACLALTVTCVFVGYAQRRRALPARGWLQSQSSVVQLGAWDKFGVSNSDTILFIVTGPDGREYRTERLGPQQIGSMLFFQTSLVLTRVELPLI